MEGVLKLKRDSGGWRHYVDAGGGRCRDLHCGCPLEVQLGEWVQDDEGEVLRPKAWLAGRYEADLAGDAPEAYLHLGVAVPNGDDLVVQLPLGIRVKV